MYLNFWGPNMDFNGSWGTLGLSGYFLGLRMSTWALKRTFEALAQGDFLDPRGTFGSFGDLWLTFGVLWGT